MVLTLSWPASSRAASRVDSGWQQGSVMVLRSASQHPLQPVSSRFGTGCNICGDSVQPRLALGGINNRCFGGVLFHYTASILSSHTRITHNVVSQHPGHARGSVSRILQRDFKTA